MGGPAGGSALERASPPMAGEKERDRKKIERQGKRGRQGKKRETEKKRETRKKE